MARSGRSWFGRLWDRLFGRKMGPPGPGGIPAAPLTLVARVSAVEEAREREMLRLADESIRRGHPDQAAIVYRKAAERYRAEGKAQKELAILNLWARVAPHDPDVWTALGRLHEAAERGRPALEAYARAAALWRQCERAEQAAALEARMAGLRERHPKGRPTQDLPPASGPASAPSAPAPAPAPVVEPAPMASSPLVVTPAGLDDDGPLELDIPASGTHEHVDDVQAADLMARAPRAPSLDLDDGQEGFEMPGDPVPERLPTGALAALEDDDDDDLAAQLEDDDEPEPLSASALEVVEEPPPIEDSSTEPGATYDRTVAMSAVDHPDFESGASTDDEISPELMAELTRMADEDGTAEEGAATIAMPAIGAQAKRAFGIPDGATVMDPRGRPGEVTEQTEETAEDDEDLAEIDDDYAQPDTRTRGYSAEELAELTRLLGKRRGGAS